MHNEITEEQLRSMLNDVNEQMNRIGNSQMRAMTIFTSWRLWSKLRGIQKAVYEVERMLNDRLV